MKMCLASAVPTAAAAAAAAVDLMLAAMSTGNRCKHTDLKSLTVAKRNHKPEVSQHGGF